MSDELFKIMATMNVLSNVQDTLLEWKILIPLVVFYLINNYAVIQIHMKSIKEYINNESTIITGSITFSTRYSHQTQDKIGALSIIHQLHKQKKDIKGLRHLEEVTQNFDMDYYALYDDDEDDISELHLFRAYQKTPIIFPNGIKLRTWKESPTDKDGKELSKEEYKIQLSYNKFSDKDKNIQFISRTINTWIDEYKKWKQINKDPNQYVFSYDSNKEDTVIYNCLKINDICKTRKHVYMDNKTQFFKRIDQFSKEKEIFIRRGKAHRLVILAYGPPGTGKTSVLYSLINSMKCGQNKYKRHLIHVNLEKLSRKDLFNLFHKEKIYLSEYKESFIEVPLDQRIYFIEEIDLIKILHTRKKTIVDIDEKELDSSLQMIQSVESLKEAIKSDKETKETKRKKDFSLIGTCCNKQEDTKCTLKDFLELLDGFPPINGSIIYMTANDITKLDSALVRPGRINIKQYFGNISKQNSIQFIENYYSRYMSREQKDTIKDNILTPAELELQCDENENIDELLKTLSIKNE